MLRVGATNEEIMEELKIPDAKKTAQRVWKARQQLKELLKEEGFEI